MPPGDTIAAIATPPGTGGIGIIRISGPRAEDIARRLYHSPTHSTVFQSHHLYHGHIISPETGKMLDDVLIALMRKPHSYTGEDVLEIHGHGSPLILGAMLAEVLRSGARIAEPGEFTRRAFLNNRIDLTQAEALDALLSANTKRGFEIARVQLDGALLQKVETWRRVLVDLTASLEASIDFAEDEREAPEHPGAAEQVQAILDEIQVLLATYETGKLIRQGAAAVIVGRPNVGKSSLLNRLLGEERAIVTAIPGTTRDLIEESMDIHGIAVRLTDTAGLHDSDNIAEKEGIARVWAKLSTADLVILVLDGSAPLTEEDRAILGKNQNRRLLAVINKTDLDHRLDEKDLLDVLPDVKPLWISAKTGEGIPALKDALYQRLTGEPMDHAETLVITRSRHKTALEKATAHLLQARESLVGAMSFEFVAFDLREALDCLGEIVGATTTDDILDRIFSTFCIGK